MMRLLVFRESILFMTLLICSTVYGILCIYVWKMFKIEVFIVFGLHLKFNLSGCKSEKHCIND